MDPPAFSGTITQQKEQVGEVTGVAKEEEEKKKMLNLNTQTQSKKEAFLLLPKMDAVRFYEQSFSRLQKVQWQKRRKGKTSDCYRGVRMFRRI